MTGSKTLPNKPSELILLALKDLILVECSKSYEIDMGEWHTPRSSFNDKCLVCFAGAIMAKTLKIDASEDVDPTDFSNATHSKLESLEFFRMGEVGDAFEILGRSYTKGLEFDRNITHYATNAGKFKREMRKLAADLAAKNY